MPETKHKKNNRRFFHPACNPEAWGAFIKNSPDNSTGARVVRIKNRRIIGYKTDGDGFAFGFFNASKGKIFVHTITLSEDAVIAMASIIHYLNKTP